MFLPFAFRLSPFVLQRYEIFCRNARVFILFFSKSLVLFILVGEVSAFHIGDVVADGLGHDGVEVGIAAEELG